MSPLQLRILCALFVAALFVSASYAQSETSQLETPPANPGRPTVANPATLAPVGYLQFETGGLGAVDSPGLSTYREVNETIKLAVSRRIQFSESSSVVAHSTIHGVDADAPGDVFLGAQVVAMLGEGARPTLAVSYAHCLYNGDSPDLDTGASRDSLIFYASADVKGFHYDANAFFDEQIEDARHRMQFGQTLSVSHSLGKSFGLSSELWHFTQPYLRGDAVGNLWAVAFTARSNLVFDAGFDKGLTITSTQWEAFAGLTYLLPHRLW
jgi:hypothetical protein